MSGFKTISYTEQKVGKRIKASKKRHTWVLQIDDNELVVELYLSKISRKVKLFINKDLVHHGKLSKSSPLNFNQEYYGKQISLLQQGKIFDLRIDSISFEYIYLQTKTKEEFKYAYEPQIVDEEEREEKRDEKVEELKAPVKAYNPFDEMFDEPKVVEKEKVSEVKNVKLKPFAIKPPPPGQVQGKGFGIFQAPELKPVKASLDGDLFEAPSKPVENAPKLLDFPQADNPFLTGNFMNSNLPKSGQYYTGQSYNHK